jgi:hypothetical protein
MVARSGPFPVAVFLGCAALVPGCAWAPKSRVDEAHKLVQTLRAENAQMKDVSLTLRVQNQELAQRAVDDARAIKALEVANGQFERSIQGYQAEREQMRAAFRDVERQARGESRPRESSAASAIVERFHAVARALPGASYDDTTGALTVPADALFLPGGSRPTSEGDAWLDELSVQVAASTPDRVDLRLADPADDPQLRRAGVAGDDTAKVLGQKRAQVIRDAVAARARIDASRVVVSILDPTRTPASGVEGPGMP